MAGTTWRCARAFEQDPSGLVDPRRPGPMSAAIPGEQVHRCTRQAVCMRDETRPLCTCGGPCTRTFLDLRLAMSRQGAACQRGSIIASPRADVAYWSVHRTTRWQNPSSAGNSAPVRQTEGSPERSRRNPRSERTRDAADRAVERFLGPTVEKITRAVLASRTGLSSDTPWLEILDALDQLEGRHGFDPGLVATLRWLTRPPPESSPRPATGGSPGGAGKGST